VTGGRRFLVVLLGSEHVEACEPWIRVLLERGHRVDLAVITPEKALRGPAQRLAEEYGGLVLQRAPKPGAREVVNLRRGLLTLADVARHQHPDMRWAAERAAMKLPASRRKDGPLPTDLAHVYRRTLGRISHPVYARRAAHHLLRLGLALEPDPRLMKWMVAQEVDVVSFSPLVTVGSPEAELALAAQAVGLPTALAVAGANDLSSQGLLKGLLDLVVVWNSHQCREAMAAHGLPRSRVAVLGSAAFDPWYAARPGRAPEELRAASGLPSEVPYVLLRSSAETPADSELTAARELAAGLAAAGSELALLIHPDARDTSRWELEAVPGATIWPKGPQTEAHGTLVDATWHSIAVISLEPTALLEAAVLGRPAFLLGGGQPDGGARTLGGDHGTAIRRVADVEALVSAVRSVSHGGLEPSAFVDSFLRPLGREIPVAPMVAEALERLPERHTRALPGEPTQPRAARAVALATALAAPGSRGWGPFLAARGRAALRQALNPPPGRAKSARAKARKAAARPSGEAKRLTVYGPWRGDATTELLYWIPWVRTACEDLESTVDSLVLHEGRDGHWYQSLGVPVAEARTLGANREAVEASIRARHPGTVVRFVDAERVESLVEGYRMGTRGLMSVVRWGSLRRLAVTGASEPKGILAIAGGGGDPPGAQVGAAETIADAAGALLAGSQAAVHFVPFQGWDDATRRLRQAAVACVTTVEMAALAVCLGVDTILINDGLDPAAHADLDVLDRVATTLGVELTPIAETGARLLTGIRGVSVTGSDW